MLTKERTKKTLLGSIAYSHLPPPHRSEVNTRRFVEVRRTRMLRAAPMPGGMKELAPGGVSIQSACLILLCLNDNEVG